jgi:hypothetical protein
MSAFTVEIDQFRQEEIGLHEIIYYITAFDDRNGIVTLSADYVRTDSTIKTIIGIEVTLPVDQDGKIPDNYRDLFIPVLYRKWGETRIADRTNAAAEAQALRVAILNSFNGVTNPEIVDAFVS